MDTQSEKLEALSQRIRQATAEAKEKQAPKVKFDTSRNAGFDFAGAVIGTGVIGFFLDRAFGTSPWWLVGMVLLGFVAGIVGAWRSMRKTRDEDTNN